MIPQPQARYGKPGETDATGGDCFAACLASVLEIPLERVPVFHSGEWWGRYQDWAEPLNLRLVWILVARRNAHVLADHKGYQIVGCDSFHGDWLHAVVYRDGRLCFDPNPTNVGRRAAEYRPRDVVFLVPIDPAQPIQKPTERYTP
jgi:hypothetical protein